MRNRGLKGVRFVVDQSGEKAAVLIDLKKNPELWEDLYDLGLARQGAREPRESLEQVKRRLRRAGKL
jgi:hypothetical protein